MNTRFVALMLAAGALAFACGPRSHAPAPEALATVSSSANVISDSLIRVAGTTGTASAANSASHRDESKRTKSTKGGDVKLDSRFHVDVKGHAVQFALAVTNVGARHVELAFPSGQSYDFVVVDSVGREVWRWANGHMFTQNTQDKQLGAGQAMQVSEAWKQPKAGHYTAIAMLKSTNYPVEQRVDFTVH